MNTKMIIALIAVVVIAGGLVYWFSTQDTQSQQPVTSGEPSSSDTTVSGSGSTNTGATGGSSTGGATTGTGATAGTNSSDQSIANQAAQIDSQMQAESAAQSASNQ